MNPKIKLLFLLWLFLLALVGCVPAASPPLALQRVLAEQTQLAVDVQLSATAEAELNDIATQVAIQHGTQLALDVQLTQASQNQQATAFAGTLQADQANATQTATAAVATQVYRLTQDADLATAVKAAANNTATVEAAMAETFAKEQEDIRNRMAWENRVRSFLLYLIPPIFLLVGLIIFWRWMVANARQRNVIRQADGDVYTIIIDQDPVQEIHMANPEKALDPVFTIKRGINGDVKTHTLAPGPVQYQLTVNTQLIQLARRYAEANRRMNDPAQIQEWKLAMQGQQPQPSNQLTAGNGMNVIHPYYGINPYSLEIIPAFNVGSKLLAGGSGSGKTNLAQFDIHRAGIEDVTIYDPKYRVGKWPAHARVIYEPADLLETVQKADGIFKTRRDEQSGKYPTHLIIVDEFTALNLLSKESGDRQTIKDAISMIWRLVMYGREFNVLLWILSQTGTAGSLGLEGRGDFRDSLTRIDFPWRPTTEAEISIPRIAEVYTGDTATKYLVPMFSQARLSLPQPLTPGLPGKPGEVGTVPDNLIIRVREDTPLAAGFTDEQIVQIFTLTKQGQSGNQIRQQLGKNRDGVYAIQAACRSLLTI